MASNDQSHFLLELTSPQGSVDTAAMDRSTVQQGTCTYPVHGILCRPLCVCLYYRCYKVVCGRIPLASTMFHMLVHTYNVLYCMVHGTLALALYIA